MTKISISTARRYLGTPWRHVGRNRAGLDCIGLLIKVLQDMSHPVYEIVKHINDYPRVCWDGKMLDTLNEHFDSIRFEDREPGDILFLCVDGIPNHVALLTELSPDYIIHAHNTRGVVEHGLGFWRARIKGIYRLRENYDQISSI